MTAGAGNGAIVEEALTRWKADPNLAGVRDADPLAKLPESEQAEWRALWADVESVLKRLIKS